MQKGYQPVLRKGDFVRVSAAAAFRPGQDGMVVEADDGRSVALVFGYDRHNKPTTSPEAMTGLTEEWELHELDLTTRDPNMQRTSVGHRLAHQGLSLQAHVALKSS
jgi:hypothetical protein